MNNYSYHLGGSLPIDSPSYVRRQNDKDLFQALKERQFCYVLNCRQMGKSSLAIKIRQQLRDEGIACDIIFLDKVGGGSATSEQWYGGMIRSLISSFMPSESFDLRSWWQENSLLSPAMRLSEFIEKILLKKVTQSIVIFYDEVDSILSLKFKHDDFFTLIRYFYNQRAINPEFNRLTFAFLGVASPSDLIQDSTKTPFNIGQKIELEGFKLEEVSPLMEGLRGKAGNPQLVMKEILFWTGGQPFLTQKLCQLVVKTGAVIPIGSEAELVQNLVRQKVIENWLDQDHPQHLKTIEDRISQSDRKARLLGLYQQILEPGEVAADDSPEQMELRLSGLVVKQQGKLKVYNRIYEAVFDKNWLVKELGTLRPYSEAMIQWIASGSQEKSWLLRGKAFKESLDWAIKNARRHNPPDEEYLNACEQQEKGRLKIRQFVQMFLILCGFLAGFIALWKAAEWQGKEKAFAQRISLGEKILTLPNIIPDVNAGAGVKAFAKKDFRQAAQQLKMARERNINNPEVLIYLNNAQIGTAPAYTIAVSVPLDKNLNVAQEILRGMAQAQDEVNRQGGINGKFLKVKIASDDNDRKIAQQVAAKFVQDSDIIAVVGHNASNASVAAAPIYEKGGLVMLSPTSFSGELSGIGKYIFRTVPNIRFIADVLAKHAVQIHKDNLVVCEDVRSLDHKSYLAEFQIALSKYGGKVIPFACDLADPYLNPDLVIKQAVNQGANGLFLAAYIDSIPAAIRVAQANQGKLKLFGSPTLYTQQTLHSGRSAVKGMVLTVPWIPAVNPQFSAKATQYWGGTVSWRTATAYDATLAIVEGLKQSNGTREGLQKALSNPLFEVKGATGTVDFLATGERLGTGILVEVQPGQKSGTGYDFVTLNTSK